MKSLVLFLLAICLCGCATTFERDGVNYEYVLDTVSWTEAKALAEKSGGQLAVFNTPEELSRVESSLPKGKIFWIGLTDSHKEGDWRWIDESPFNTELAGKLFRGGNLAARDYGYILLQGGIGARANTGELPRGARGRKYVDGYLIQYK